MTTWPEIRTYLRGSVKLSTDEDAALAFAYSVPIENAEIVQRIGMSPTTVHDRPWLAIIAELFAEASLPIRTAVLYQDRFPSGAIVTRNGYYLMRTGVLLEPLTLPDLEWTLRMVVHEAVRLRVNLRSAGPAADAFANYSE